MSRTVAASPLTLSRWAEEMLPAAGAREAILLSGFQDILDELESRGEDFAKQVHLSIDETMREARKA